MTTTLEELRAKLAQTTDGDEYDKIQAAIAQAEKESRLATNRRAAEERAAAERALKARMRKYEAGRADLQKGREQAAELDQGLFDDLAQLYERLLLRHRLEVSLYEKGGALNLEAQALGQPEIENPPMTVCGCQCHGMSASEAITLIVNQYGLATGQIKDAKRIGNVAPAKPGMDWYQKGDGRFWPTE